jgi:tankyrase
MKKRRVVILVAGVSLAMMLLFFLLPFAKQRAHNLLCKAALHGDISMVKACLMVRPDLNKHPTDGDGFTGFLALECAAIGGNADIVMLLLQNGANPNPPGPNPLITACSLGHSEVVKLLLEHGADPNANGNNDGDGTPLNAATGHPEIIKLLRSYGANE